MAVAVVGLGAANAIGGGSAATSGYRQLPGVVRCTAGPAALVLVTETRRLIGWLPGEPGGHVAGTRAPPVGPRERERAFRPPPLSLSGR